MISLWTFVIGLLLGWYSKKLISLMQKGIEKIASLEKTVDEKGDSGVISRGKVYQKGQAIKLPTYNPSDSPIVRPPNPRAVALQEAAERSREDHIG